MTCSMIPAHQLTGFEYTVCHILYAHITLNHTFALYSKISHSDSATASSIVKLKVHYNDRRVRRNCMHTARNSVHFVRVSYNCGSEHTPLSSHQTFMLWEGKYAARRKRQQAWENLKLNAQRLLCSTHSWPWRLCCVRAGSRRAHMGLRMFQGWDWSCKITSYWI